MFMSKVKKKIKIKVYNLNEFLIFVMKTISKKMVLKQSFGFEDGRALSFLLGKLNSFIIDFEKVLLNKNKYFSLKVKFFPKRLKK